MTDSDKVFAGSIPQIYDDYLVPLIFEHFARDLARRAVQWKPRAVMEIAAGTGVVTRALAPLLAPDAGYLVTDLNPAMLDRAKARQPDSQRLNWAVADAMALNVAPASHDVVLCQFGVMFFPDRAACHQGIHKALRPGGTWLFNVWDRIETNELADEVTRALAAIYPDDPPEFMPRTPHGYFDVAQIRDDLKKGGFSDVVVETIGATSHAPDARAAAIAYCQGTPLRNEIEQRDASQLQAVTDLAESLISKMFGSGTVEGKIQALVFTAR